MSRGSRANHPHIRNYGDARRTFENTKDLRTIKGFKPLDRRSRDATASIRKDGEDYVIKLYQTDIIRYKPDGSIFLYHGGWESGATATAIGHMGGVSCGRAQNALYVSVRSGSFLVPDAGLLLVRDAGGVLEPVNPPVATVRKTRVRKEEARMYRKYFAQVPKLIVAYSAAFKGGAAASPTPVLPLRDYYLSGGLTEEAASTIAMYFLDLTYDWGSREQMFSGYAKGGIKDFWKTVYQEFSLVETYKTELPYGVVAK